MAPKFLQRNIFQRLFGIPATPRPGNPGCWQYAKGRLNIDLDKTPELAKPGGALRFEGDPLPVRVLLVHGEDGRLRAFHNRCSHVGHRRLDYVPGSETVQCCSVSKSTYGYDGSVLYGPAPEAITVYPLEIEGRRLTVMLAE
jgi:nitrite reductase/ring-hydroxylating ferredoxin subunit